MNSKELSQPFSSQVLMYSVQMFQTSGQTVLTQPAAGTHFLPEEMQTLLWSLKISPLSEPKSTPSEWIVWESLWYFHYVIMIRMEKSGSHRPRTLNLVYYIY